MKKRRIVYIIFIIILIILANISLYYYLYFDNLRLHTTDITRLTINEKNSLTYNIESVDNNFYNSKNTKDYDVNNIKSIDAFFNYQTLFDKAVTGDYTYYVRGVLFDNVEEKKEIYRSIDYKYELDNKNIIKINQLTNINLKDIIKNNKEIADYFKAKIKYELVVTYHIYNKEIDKYVTNSKEIEIDIPITTGEYITVTPSEEKSYKEFSNEIKNDKTYLIICCEFLGSVVLYILCITYLIERITPVEEINDEELNSIKKKYKDSLVKINFLPNLTNKDVVFVDTMDELLAQSKLHKVPIDFVEIIKHKETIFTVIYDNYAYVYKVSVSKKRK